MLPSMAPRKKFRERRRYYAKLAKATNGFSIKLTDGHWYDLGHQHFDWRGNGNRSRQDRIKHLLAYATAFKRAAVQMRADKERSFQMFVSIVSDDSGGDALYFHTPNPQNTMLGHAPFPTTEFAGRWEDDPDIKQFFDPMFAGIKMRYCLNRSDTLMSRSITIYSPECGVPLEK